MKDIWFILAWRISSKRLWKSQCWSRDTPMSNKEMCTSGTETETIPSKTDTPAETRPPEGSFMTKKDQDTDIQDWDQYCIKTSVEMFLNSKHDLESYNTWMTHAYTENVIRNRTCNNIKLMSNIQIFTALEGNGSKSSKYCYNIVNICGMTSEWY